MLVCAHRGQEAFHCLCSLKGLSGDMTSSHGTSLCSKTPRSGFLKRVIIVLPQRGVVNRAADEGLVDTADSVPRHPWGLVGAG